MAISGTMVEGGVTLDSQDAVTWLVTTDFPPEEIQLGTLQTARGYMVDIGRLHFEIPTPLRMYSRVPCISKPILRSHDS